MKDLTPKNPIKRLLKISQELLKKFFSTVSLGSAQLTILFAFCFFDDLQNFFQTGIPFLLKSITKKGNEHFGPPKNDRTLLQNQSEIPKQFFFDHFNNFNTLDDVSEKTSFPINSRAFSATKSCVFHPIGLNYKGKTKTSSIKNPIEK